MKINDNISITGVYHYSPSCEYEENDFVIYEGQLYVCHPKEGKTVIGGEDGPDVENFVAYLGDMSAEVEDLMEFLDGGGKNKLLTVPMLHVFRNHFMFGLDDRGIIGDTEATVDTIFCEDSLNNAMFKISRSSLKDILLYTPDPKTDLEMKTKVSQKYYDTDLDHVILKQYTYYLKDDIKIRVQELVDPWNGLIYLRHGKLPDINETVGKIEWKCTSENVLALRKKAEVIFDLYGAKLKALDEIKERLQNNFRYRRLDFDPGTVVKLEIPTDRLYLNVTLTTKSGSPKQLFEVPVDGSGDYGFGGGVLKVAISGNTVTLTSPTDIEVTGAYYQEYYDF